MVNIQRLLVHSYMLPVDRSGKSIPWAQLSNSGDTLKLLIPSHSRKAMNGQNNYLGTVISQEMIVNEMGYRGSKSSAIALVKEQRVDGSYSFQVGLLRCTLMAPVKGYQTEILSNKKNNVSENVVVVYVYSILKDLGLVFVVVLLWFVK